MATKKKPKKSRSRKAAEDNVWEGLESCALYTGIYLSSIDASARIQNQVSKHFDEIGALLERANKR